MSRHIRWGCIIPLGFLIFIAASTSAWLPVLMPNAGQSVEEDRFQCPETVSQEICAALTAIYESDPAQVEAMVVAVLAPPVPAPSDEEDDDSIYGDIDPNSVSQITETMLRLGEFTTLDVLHGAKGRAVVWEVIADTTILRVLRFDREFIAANGPDLRVYLSISSSPRTLEEMRYGNIEVDLGPLKGNVGSQNYALDEDLDITLYSSVVIYSESLGVIFSVAPLQQPIR